MFVKRAIQGALGQFGYQVRRAAPCPFPEIANEPRYRPRTVKLFGHDFQVTDAASFLASYQEIFEREIYRFETDKLSPRIIDCGANYGVSLLYLKRLYPAARITGVEADPAIHAVCTANLTAAGIHDVEVLQKAVSHSHDALTFFSEGADAGRLHGLQGSKASTRVEAVTLDDLITGPVDFLKIDIEGAETEALKACTRLDQVAQMFIEYHSFRDSPQTLSELLAILQKHGFRYYIQTQFCAAAPLRETLDHLGMDLGLNIFATRPTALQA